MDVRLKFLGAAQSVTGSKYLLEIDQKKILVDSGLFQGQKELRLRNWKPLPVRPDDIDLIIITHAHIDHVGYLPRLIRDGYKGKIICTAATEDLMKIMLLDAAKLQEEEALFAFKRGYSKHTKPEPLFTEQDARQVLTMVESHPLETKIQIDKKTSIVFRNSGHILGSAFIEFAITGETQTKKIIFSGDLGRYEDPIMYAPSVIDYADAIIVESTYGDRTNPMDEVENDLTEIINEAYANEGAIIIPAFAIGRTQTLVYYLHKLMAEKKIPMLSIYVDSPMATNVTNLYERHSKDHKIKVTNQNGNLISIFDSPNIHFCATRERSKALNDMKKPCIIISASGMVTGGRILHHLFHRLPKENNTVLFAGYQAEGSRGRTILDGESTVRIFGEDVPIRCHVRQINGLSAHADQHELLQWLHGITNKPKAVFITHGELPIAEQFAKKIEEEFGWKPTIPAYQESVDLFTGI